MWAKKKKKIECSNYTLSLVADYSTKSASV